MRWYCFAVMLLSAAILIRCSPATLAGDKDKKEPDKSNVNDKKPTLLVIPPAGGKEVKLIDWRFTVGTRHLDLHADKATGPKTKRPAGPEYLEFRDDKSTTYKNGIYTFVPLTSIRKLDYDKEKKTVTLVTVQDGGENATLTGSTKFVSNKITIEADAILEGLGAATVKFQGGLDSNSLIRVTFPNPKPAEKVSGASALIIADDKEKTKHTAYDLQPIYLIDGNYRVLPYVMFKKTVKIEMDKIASIRFVPSLDKKKPSTDYEVTLRDGVKHTLQILRTIELEKKKSMTFVGLLGRVPVGYKLFMVDAIFEYRVANEDKKQ